MLTELIVGALVGGATVKKYSGMTQEEIRRAAEPFYKADKSRSAAGYGIGLSICKSICTLFKTELKFESELGRGTCVSFDLEVTE